MDDADRGGTERKKPLETGLNLIGGPNPVPDLKSALRRARIENAERAAVIAELRGAEIARLEMLEEQLEPVLAQVPQDCDLFDVALLPSEHPRLFIDMPADIATWGAFGTSPAWPLSRELGRSSELPRAVSAK